MKMEKQNFLSPHTLKKINKEISPCKILYAIEKNKIPKEHYKITFDLHNRKILVDKDYILKNIDKYRQKRNTRY